MPAQFDAFRLPFARRIDGILYFDGAQAFQALNMPITNDLLKDVLTRHESMFVLPYYECRVIYPGDTPTTAYFMALQHIYAVLKVNDNEGVPYWPATLLKNANTYADEMQDLHKLYALFASLHPLEYYNLTKLRQKFQMIGSQGLRKLLDQLEQFSVIANTPVKVTQYGAPEQQYSLASSDVPSAD